jgi:hypothetical protein
MAPEAWVWVSRSVRWRRVADIIAVRVDALNTAPAADLPLLLTHAARPDNVSLVLIDGVAHKRDGQLVRVDLPAIRARASASIAKILSALPSRASAVHAIWPFRRFARCLPATIQKETMPRFDRIPAHKEAAE